MIVRISRVCGEMRTNENLSACPSLSQLF